MSRDIDKEELMSSLDDPILTRKRQTIDSLQRSLNEGEHGLKAVPGLVRQILQDRMWDSFPVELGGELDPEYGLDGHIKIKERIGTLRKQGRPQPQFDFEYTLNGVNGAD